MIKYVLSLDLLESQITLAEGETFDEWVANNIFPVVANKLEELGMEGGIGFAHYCHSYNH